MEYKVYILGLEESKADQNLGQEQLELYVNSIEYF